MRKSPKEILHHSLVVLDKSVAQLLTPPRFMSVLGVTVLGLLLIVAWGCQESPPIDKTPIATVFKAPTSVVSEKLYSNNLFYFNLDLAVSAQSFKVMESADVCRGTVFSSDANTQEDAERIDAQFRICYLDTVTVIDADALLNQLDRRSEVVKKGLQAGADEGLPKTCSIGKEKLACLERYVQGKPNLGQGDTRWYLAIVGYEGRLYSVEADCKSDSWAKFWPDFQSVMRTLRFESGVVPQVTP